MSFKISKNCVYLITKYEGFRSNAYQDSVGVWTIGYGTTRINGRPVKSTDTIQEKDALAYMMTEVQEFMDQLSFFIYVPLSQNEIDAIGSFVYNVGVSAVAKSTFLKYLNAGRKIDAADQLVRQEGNVYKGWINAGGKPLQGLINRRMTEKALFLLKDG